jgi:hypothetical protein
MVTYMVRRRQSPDNRERKHADRMDCCSVATVFAPPSLRRGTGRDSNPAERRNYTVMRMPRVHHLERSQCAGACAVVASREHNVAYAAA